MGRKSIDRSRKKLSNKMEQWVDSILATLQHENLSELTVDDIAKLTSKSKSTIYEYFDSKESIILTAVERRLEQLEAIPQVEDHQSILDSYLALVNWLANNLQDISFNLLFQLKSDFPASWDSVESFQSDLLHTLQKHYEAGIEAGLFRNMPVDLLVEMDRHFIMTWLSASTKEQTIDQLIHSYVDLRLNGILNA